MADEQIDELIIDVSVHGAEQTNRQLDLMSQRLDSLRRAIPNFDDSWQRLEDSMSSSNVSKGIKGIEEGIKNASNYVNDFSDKWEYLNDPIERTKSHIELLERELERYKKSFEEAKDDSSSQDSLQKRIENTQSAIERQQKQLEKMVSTAEELDKVKPFQNWEYLNEQTSLINTQLERAEANLIKLKDSWANATSPAQQEKITVEIEKTSQAIKKYNDQLSDIKRKTEDLPQSAKDWSYLETPIGRLSEKLKRTEERIKSLKEEFSQAKTGTEQNRIIIELEKASTEADNLKNKISKIPMPTVSAFSQEDKLRFAQMAEQAKKIAQNATKDWSYLQNPLSVIEEKIRRLTYETDNYKKAWEKSTDIEEQDRLANKIETNTDKIRKLTAEKEKLSQGEGGTDGGFQGLLSSVQGIASMIGKTGGQISGLIGKASSLGSALKGVAGTAASIALPVGLIVGAINLIKKGADAIKQTGKDLLTLAKNIANIIGEEIKKKIDNLIEPIKRLKKQIGRVVFNRLIREAFNLVQTGIAEGLKNVARGFERANVALSKYATQITYLKNTLGAMFIPILENLYPAFELVTNAVIKASNAINQFMSLISGKSTYIKAQKQYVNYADSINSSSKKAQKSMQNLLASFDELHDITESATNTGTEDDYTQFFTEAGIETNIDAFYKRLRDGFKKGDLSSVGTDLANKLNVQLEKFIDLVKWDNVKEKITTKISAITSGIRSFLKTFIENRGFENLGKSVGNGLNTIVKSLVTFGEQMREKLTEINGVAINGFAAIGVGIADTLYGMIMSIDWEAVGTLLLEEIIKIFDIAKGFAARMLETVVYNGETMTRIEAMVTKLMQGLASALETAIEKSEFTSMGETIGNMLIVIFQAGAAIFTKSKFWENLATAVNNVISALAKKMQDPNFLSALTDFVVATVNGVATLLSSIDLGKVLNAISNVITKLSKDPQVQNAISNFGSALGNIAGEMFLFKFKLKFVKIITFINTISAGLSGIIGTIMKKVTGAKSADAAIENVFGYWTPSFATGGFPEDGLFYANHNELVGSFSNGKTAVANNMQIVDGIKQGVKEAMVESRGTQSASTQLSGDVIINGKKAGKILAKDVGEELNRSGFKLRKA